MRNRAVTKRPILILLLLASTLFSSLPSDAAARTLEECVSSIGVDGRIVLENSCDETAILEIVASEGICAEKLCRLELPALASEELEEVPSSAQFEYTGCLAEQLAAETCALKTDAVSEDFVVVDVGGAPYLEEAMGSMATAIDSLNAAQAAVACIRFESRYSDPAVGLRALGRNVCDEAVIVKFIAPDCKEDWNCGKTWVIAPGDTNAMFLMSDPNIAPVFAACKESDVQSGVCAL